MVAVGLSLQESTASTELGLSAMQAVLAYAYDWKRAHTDAAFPYHGQLFDDDIGSRSLNNMSKPYGLQSDCD